MHFAATAPHWFFHSFCIEEGAKIMKIWNNWMLNVLRLFESVFFCVGFYTSYINLNTRTVNILSVFKWSGRCLNEFLKSSLLLRQWIIHKKNEYRLMYKDPFEISLAQGTTMGTWIKIHENYSVMEIQKYT